GIANMANAPCDVVGLRERDGLSRVAGIEVKINRDDKQCNWREKLVLYVLGITGYKFVVLKITALELVLFDCMYDPLWCKSLWIYTTSIPEVVYPCCIESPCGDMRLTAVGWLLSFLRVICFVNHSCQPSWETYESYPYFWRLLQTSHEGYRNTIELPKGNIVVPLRSDTIRLVQNGCLLHGLRSKDPNQHLKDFLKLVDSLDLDDANRERTRLHLFQFSLHDQASNWLEHLLAGSISTWEDLTTRFLAQFFPSGRTVKLRNNILMFQQHQGDLSQKHGLVSRTYSKKSLIVASIVGFKFNFSMIMSSFILSERFTTSAAANSAIRAPKNLRKTLRTSPSITMRAGMTQRTSSNRLRSRPTPKRSSTHTPQAYANAVYPNPQPQALGTSFEARVQDYMVAHTERMERFENAIFKQREEINDRMAEIFGLLKELTTIRAPEKVLIREEAKYPVTKNVNSISLTRGEEEKNYENDVMTINDIIKTNGSDTKMPVKKSEKENEAKNGTKNEPIKRAEREEAVEAPNSQPVGYYLKYRINEKLIEGLFDNHRGLVYEAILKKNITRKEDIRENFEIPCNIGGLKHMNVLVDQESDVNIMPLSTYMKLTDERPAETDIRLSLASHYIYPLGITEDVLVDVDGYVYPMNFMILDIREDEKRPFILGTPFLTTAKAMIKFDKGIITLRSGKSKISFHRKPESLGKVEKGIKNDIERIAPIMTVNRLVLEWEEMIQLHQEKEIKFDQ
ncbi:zinc finger, CCHC-type containing protein, partial [Tanacetum coccineum]